MGPQMFLIFVQVSSSEAWMAPLCTYLHVERGSIGIQESDKVCLSLGGITPHVRQIILFVRLHQQSPTKVRKEHEKNRKISG